MVSRASGEHRIIKRGKRATRPEQKIRSVLNAVYSSHQNYFRLPVENFARQEQRTQNNGLRYNFPMGRQQMF